MQQKIITLVGGTGFLGRYIIPQLASSGYGLRVISRNPANAIHLKTSGEPGQVVLTYGNLSRPESLREQIKGSHAVINMVGILFEGRGQTFSALHAQGAEQLAKMAKMAGVKRFIHISALGVDKAATSKYARTKITGEKAVTAAFPGATILRPGVIFGPEDYFYNRFAAMAQYMPFLPLIGGGEMRFQPVYVRDVAQAVQAVLERDSSKGRIYELGGPEVFTLRQILQYVMRVTGREKMLLPISFPLATLMGLLYELTPFPMLTRDQVKLLHYDNLVDERAHSFRELGISPTAVQAIVPHYLQRFSKRHASPTPHLFTSA